MIGNTLADDNVTHMKDDNDSNNTDSLSAAAKTTNETREYIYQQLLNKRSKRRGGDADVMQGFSK